MSAPEIEKPLSARQAEPAASELSPRELARWAWRQLTSMRTALLLLLLLALAAVPGSIVPQRNIAARDVAQFKADNPTLGGIYERIGMFSVYDSVWFSAIYLLLMVSLVGCIIPRLRVHYRALRTPPPPTPRNLDRLPAYTRVEVDGSIAGDELMSRARAELRRRHYKIVDHPHSVSAERGYLREAGNLLFHVSVVVVLVGFAIGQLFGFKGGVIVLVGNGFSNSTSQYDEFTPGSLYNPEDLAPIALKVDDFVAEFIPEGPQRGQPTDFYADLTYTEDIGAAPVEQRIAVNEPLMLDGLDVFLVGHGYAPVITVKDGTGEIAYSGPAVFLPQDSTFASFGVVKIPGARPQQLGIEGLFLPTYGFTPEQGPFSTYPDALDPKVSLTFWAGDLSMDDGEPQSVYELDTDQLTKVQKADGSGDFRADLAVGQTKVLPGSLGSIRLDGWQRWTKLQVSDTPGKLLTLAGTVAALVGLMGSLYIRRRRTWVRFVPATSTAPAFLEVGGLDRSSLTEGLSQEIVDISGAVAGRATPHDTLLSPPPGILERSAEPGRDSGSASKIDERGAGQ